MKNKILDLFFPAKCVSCGRLGEFICVPCCAEIKFIKKQTCLGCNCLSDRGRLCKRCRSKYALTGVVAASYLNEGALKEAVHSFKYNSVSAIAKELAEILSEKLKEERIFFDAVAFVPISKKRKAWRGYNQSEILAEIISAKFERDIFRGLIKTKDTKNQVGLGKLQREKNLARVFDIKKGGMDITGKRVLLVDDVVTTGTTLNECAKTLRANGAREVWGAVVAKE